MADETTPFPNSNPPPPAREPQPKPEQPTAAVRLREFEDDVFGKDTPRISGAVERGIGSPFAKMTDGQKARHAGLEKLIDAEKAVSHASAALAAASAELDAAQAKAE